MNNQGERKVIGRREIANFPALNLEGVRLKIDTGAYSSAIHCSTIYVDSDRVLHVVFLHPDEDGFTGQTAEFNEFDRRNIRSSSGHRESRYAINTKISFGSKIYKIRLTLTDRSSMRYPVLIGRRFLKRNKFIVDPSATDSLS